MLLVITLNRVTEYQTTVNKCQRYYSLCYHNHCKILFYLIVKEYLSTVLYLFWSLAMFYSGEGPSENLNLH